MTLGGVGDRDVVRRRIRGAGVDLAVYEVGPSTRRPVVIAHGVGSSGRFIVEAFASAAESAGRRLITYDLRGHGASSPVTAAAEHGLERHTADLHAVASSVRADVVGGVSLGGHAAVAYAADRPDLAGAVACFPAWTGRAVPGVGPHAVMARDAREVGIAAMIERFRADTTMPAWLRELLTRDWSAHPPDSLAAALQALDGGLAPTEADLRHCRAPLAVVGWPGDPGHPLDVARSWASWAPRGTLFETSLGAIGDDRATLGTVAFEALERARRSVPGGVPFGEDGLRST